MHKTIWVGVLLAALVLAAIVFWDAPEGPSSEQIEPTEPSVQEQEPKPSLSGTDDDSSREPEAPGEQSAPEATPPPGNPSSSRQGITIELRGLSSTWGGRVKLSVSGSGLMKSWTGRGLTHFVALRPGTYQVKARIGGDLPLTAAPATAIVVRDQTTDPVVLLMRPESDAEVMGIRLRVTTPGGSEPEQVRVLVTQGKRRHQVTARAPLFVVPLKSGAYRMRVVGDADGQALTSEVMDVSVAKERSRPDQLPTHAVELLPRNLLHVRFESDRAHAGGAWVRYAALEDGRHVEPTDPELAWRGGIAHDKAQEVADPATGHTENQLTFNDLLPGRYIVAAFSSPKRTGLLDYQVVEFEGGEMTVVLEPPPVSPDEYIKVRVLDEQGEPVRGLTKFTLGFGLEKGNGGSSGGAELIEESNGVYSLLPSRNGLALFRGPMGTRDDIWGYPWTRTRTSKLRIFVRVAHPGWKRNEVRGLPKAGEVLVIRLTKAN